MPKGIYDRTITPRPRTNRKEVFWSKVDFDGPEIIPGSPCWIWNGAKGSSKYGEFWNGYNTIGAHVFSWILKNGEKLSSLSVLHKCDNTICVNYDHLFLGTIKENMDDRDNKGRQAKGQKHGRSKITEEDVIMIRKQYLAGFNVNELANLFPIGASQIGKIINGGYWKHV